MVDFELGAEWALRGCSLGLARYFSSGESECASQSGDLNVNFLSILRGRL
jgi:hypothetical protein